MEPIWETATIKQPDTPPCPRPTSTTGAKPADRAKYQFEADSEDDQMEDEIDRNIDELSGAAKRLNLLARATGPEVEAQNRLIGRIARLASPPEEICMLLSSSTTTASVLTGPKTLEVVTRPLPLPQPDEVQVAVKATGIYGSDLHYHAHFSVDGFPVLEPLTLGHESGGIITALGHFVLSTHPNLKVGDRVALEVGVPCSKSDCDRCAEGRYNICPNIRFRSSARSVPHYQGTLQERVNHPGRWCWKLPESVSLQEGALVEPLSVAIHSVRRSGLMTTETRGAGDMKAKACLVLGAGTIGMMTAAVLRVSGAKTVVVADVNEARVTFAVENDFADRGVVVERTVKEEGTIEEQLQKARVAAKRFGKECHYGSLRPIGEFDVVFECTGVESCVQTAIYATRPGGKVLLVGIGPANQTLPIAAASQQEIDLVGVFRYASYEDGIEMIAAANEGRPWKGAPEGARPLPDLKKLITHRFQGLKGVKYALDMASRGTDHEGRLVMKVMVEV